MRTSKQQAEKISEEISEFLRATGQNQDLEAVDILHAVETFIMVHFKDREEILDYLLLKVRLKNHDRGYYQNKVF